MQRVILLLLVGLVSPRLAYAQGPRAPGVRFEQGMSWSAVRAKAKAANRHIFMVLSTTSCQLCKWMEQQVYTQDKVSSYLNEKFIAVRVQLDTTPHDNPDVKRWYAEARKLRQRYTVTAFPTFLFFSPDGKLVHRGRSRKTAEALLALAADALNPAKQYYTRLASYQRGHKDVAAVPELAQMAQALGDTATVQRLVGDYLTRLNGTELYTKENLKFLRVFTRRSSDRSFAFFHPNGAKVDSVLGAGVAQSVVDWIITNEEIRPSVAAAEQGGPPPDWGRITATIAQKYGAKYADRTVVMAKVDWYRAQQDWPNYISSLITKIENYGPTQMTGFATVLMNNAAWDVFKYSADTAALAKALAWSDRVVKVDPRGASRLDTYANLLYKLGRTEEALRWEEVAVKLAPNVQAFAVVLEKMKKGEPTWPQP